MKCKNCGNEFEGNFCPECGTKVDSEQAPQQINQNIENVESNKKPFYKNWLFWTICAVGIVFIIIFIFLAVKTSIPKVEKAVVSTTQADEEITYDYYALNDVHFNIPSSFVKGTINTGFSFSAGSTGILNVEVFNHGSYVTDDNISDFIDKFDDDVDNYDEILIRNCFVSNNYPAQEVRFTCDSGSGTNYYNIYCFGVGNYIYKFTFLSLSNTQCEDFNNYENDIIKQIEIPEIETTVEEETTIKPTEKATEKPTEKATEKKSIENNTSTGGFYANGSGDYVANGLKVEGYGILHVSYSGSGNFSVISYEGDEYDKLLVNEIGNYSGDVLIDHAGTFNLEISGEGSWNITSSGLSVDDGTSFSGSGDSVTGITSHDGGSWHITNNGSSNFSVIEYGMYEGYMKLMVNEIGNYEGTVKADSGDDIFFEINSDGNWSINKN